MKKSIIFAVSILSILIFATNILAHDWACLSYGDRIPNYQCFSDLCILCLDDNGYSTDFGFCKEKQDCVLNNAANDSTSPEMRLYSPITDAIYNKSKILFNLTSSEPSTVYYKINNDNEDIWKKLARNIMNYNKEITFRDGYKDISIKTVDRFGNFNKTTRKFYVDTRKPKVNHPVLEGNGLIKVKFEEANPTSLKLIHGNNISGYSYYEVNLSNCNISNGRTLCENFITLNELINIFEKYNQENTQTWMELTDIAGNIAVSRKKDGIVDYREPIVNNLNDSVFINGKYVTFNISITEFQFKGVFIAKNSTNIKWRKICSSLKNDLCIKRLNFLSGEHDILVKVMDKSDNFVINEYKFIIE